MLGNVGKIDLTSKSNLIEPENGFPCFWDHSNQDSQPRNQDNADI